MSILALIKAFVFVSVITNIQKTKTFKAEKINLCWVQLIQISLYLLRQILIAISCTCSLLLINTSTFTGHSVRVVLSFWKEGTD